MVWKELATGRFISPERYVAVILVGCVDQPKNRLFGVHKGDIDGKLAVLLEELLGAVERIDEEEAVLDIGDIAGGERLFGDDRDIREQLRKRLRG